LALVFFTDTSRRTSKERTDKILVSFTPVWDREGGAGNQPKHKLRERTVHGDPSGVAQR